MFCSSCGKKITDKSKFCKHCGSSQAEIVGGKENKKTNKKNYEIVWACDFCRKEFITKKESDKHELSCQKNPIVYKNNKKFLKLSKISGIIWAITVALFFSLAFLSDKIPQLSLENSRVSSFLLSTTVVIGIVSFLITVTNLALNLSFGKHFREKPIIKIFRLVLSLIFLPILVMRNFFGVIFGLFVLLPVWGLGFIFALLILGVIRPSTPVIGNSMNPTILNQEEIELGSFTFFNRLFVKPQKGDIVTFESGRTTNPDGEIATYIKRIVAIGGDEVSIRDGFLYINNQLVKEPYTAKPRSTFGGSFLADCKTIKIPDGYYFVLGDNRKRSKDSRDIGLVSINEIDSILPFSKQDQFQERLRDASSDGIDHGLPSYDLDDYYQRINKIREDNDLKPLKRNEKLEKAAMARAKSIIENNEVEFIGKGEKSKYSYSEAIRDTGYNNVTTGEIVTTGYYDSEELSNYWLDYGTKNNLLNKLFQDTGIASYVGKIDDCEVQVIVQEFGGYVPPNYSKETVQAWRDAVNNLNSIIPSWEQTKGWPNMPQDELDMLLNLLYKEKGIASNILDKMESNKWLTAQDEQSINEYNRLIEQSSSLADKLNSR